MSSVGRVWAPFSALQLLASAGAFLVWCRYVPWPCGFQMYGSRPPPIRGRLADRSSQKTEAVHTRCQLVAPAAVKLLCLGHGIVFGANGVDDLLRVDARSTCLVPRPSGVQVLALLVTFRSMVPSTRSSPPRPVVVSIWYEWSRFCFDFTVPIVLVFQPTGFRFVNTLTRWWACHHAAAHNSNTLAGRAVGVLLSRVFLDRSAGLDYLPSRRGYNRLEDFVCPAGYPGPCPCCCPLVGSRNAFLLGYVQAPSSLPFSVSSPSPSTLPPLAHQC